jgi:hypothetical protein
MGRRRVVNRLWTTLVWTIALLPAAGCSLLQSEAVRGHDDTHGWDVPVSFTTADVRIVTKRKHPLLGNDVVCAEPAPDVVKALTQALQASAQGGNATTSAGGAFAASVAEAAMELAGRSTALLGLRDGLYRACEAYANGIIGADMYALVVSRYGQLMTTLFLGQDITGAAGTRGGGTVQSPPVTITLPSPSGGADKKSSSDTSKNSTDKNKTPESTGDAGDVVDAGKGTQVAAADTTTNKNGAATGGNGTDTGAAKPQTDQTSIGVSAGAAAALTRMNEDYLLLDLNLLHTLFVACINEADPTRYHAPAPALAAGASTEPGRSPFVTQIDNLWLRRLCDSVSSVDKISQVVAQLAAAMGNVGKLVDPTTTVTLTSPPAEKKSQPTPAPKLDAQTCRIQQALKDRGYDPGKLDCAMGPNTARALTKFQGDKNLPATGKVDVDTLKALGVG